MSKMGDLHLEIQEEVATALRNLGTPIDWVDVGFSIMEVAAIHECSEEQVFAVVEDMLNEGYTSAKQIMKGDESAET